MSDNELLLAFSSMMDEKLQTIEQNMNKRLDDIHSDIKLIKLDIENDVKPCINLLAENYLPSAKRYESATNKIEMIENDVRLIKQVVTEHSEKLQKIS